MNLKIRELAGRVASMGVTFVDHPRHRKLEPGEVMECPEDLDITPIRHLVEYTDEPATRPVIFENETEAKYTSPSYRIRFDTDEADMVKHRAIVAERLAKPRRGRPPKEVE